MAVAPPGGSESGVSLPPVRLPSLEAHRCGGTTPLMEVAAALRAHRGTLAATEAAAAVLEQAEFPLRRQPRRRSRSRSPPRHPALALPVGASILSTSLAEATSTPKKEEVGNDQVGNDQTRNTGNCAARDNFESARASET